MKSARSLAELDSFTAAAVVPVGTFARELNAQAVAGTFDPHPAHVLRTDSHLPLITPVSEKLELLAATGLDLVLVLPFTEELRHWTARHFAERVLHEALHAVEVHEGETFRFGHQAEADIAGLSQLGVELGFAVRTYVPRIARGKPISSSRIRALIAAGNLHEARALLGRSFSIRSTPASGRGYGTRHAVPTINLAPYSELLPAHGVYITTLKIAGERLFRGVTNIGNRPTFGADSFAVETHLFDFEPIALNESTPLEMTFLQRLRAERRFESTEALRTQIGLDVKHALRYFALADALHARLL